jgi:hypothetical protein
MAVRLICQYGERSTTLAVLSWSVLAKSSFILLIRLGRELWPNSG